MKMTALRDPLLMSFPEFNSDVAPLPSRIKVEITTRCNLACRFCGRALALESRLKQEGVLSLRNLLRESRCFGHDLSLADFQRLLTDLPQVRQVDLQGVGEPLINPAVTAMIEWASRRGISTSFTTNGLLLTAHMAQILVANNVGQITISVDGATPATYSFIRRGSSLSTVIANITRLTTIRASAQSRTPRIRLAMVLTRYNISELPALIDLARQCGADAVTCTALKPVAPFLVDWIPTEDAVQELVGEAAARAVALGVEFECEVALPEPLKGKKKPTRTICAWPWLSAMVTVDGYVTPCCYVTQPWVYSLGRIQDESFTTIWNGPRYQELRRKLREGDTADLPCQTCYDHVGLSPHAHIEVKEMKL